MNEYAINTVTISGEAPPMASINIEGSADLALDAAVDLALGMTVEGAADVALSAGGGLMVGATIEGEADIDLTAALAPMLMAKISGDALIDVVVSGSGSAGKLIDGAAPMALDAAGDLFTAHVKKIYGGAPIYTDFRAKGRRYAIVKIEGEAQIDVVLKGNKAGRRPLPDVYIPAPNSRRFIVARQPRERDFFYNRRV